LHKRKIRVYLGFGLVSLEELGEVLSHLALFANRILLDQDSVGNLEELWFVVGLMICDAGALFVAAGIDRLDEFLEVMDGSELFFGRSRIVTYVHVSALHDEAR
jgi:hypothetical protein